MLEQMLEDLELDVIAVNTFRKKDSLQYRKVADEEFVLAVPAGSPLITASEEVEGCKYPGSPPGAAKSPDLYLSLPAAPDPSVHG